MLITNNTQYFIESQVRDDTVLDLANTALKTDLDQFLNFTSKETLLLVCAINKSY